MIIFLFNSAGLLDECICFFQILNTFAGEEQEYAVIKNATMVKTLQFKITLPGTSPLVWRRFMVAGNIMFYDLHLTIQVVMGWENDHLYQFIYDKNNFIGNPELLEEMGDEVADDLDTEVSAVMDVPGTMIIYEYDFGDDWKHEVVLEKVLDIRPKHQLPYCLEGESNCPPEDCGGLPGFQNLLKIIKNKKHPEHGMVMEWLGKGYDPARFNQAAVNRRLKKIRDMG